MAIITLILQEMNVEQNIIVQQIFKARKNNNASAEVINDLVRQNIQLSQRYCKPTKYCA
ncbi:hypothetical protein CPX_001754 [Candidatus Phytoplasma pruni]|uniref:Uncharacterized protein n=1 Tax=Candidatus Phytoplasma pruni TaxID=479893 RepID=A0A0M1MZF4_9MOLU|nr:hypothetical protein CPX_001754 [Candidatus Phytoplasma pruni]